MKESKNKIPFIDDSELDNEEEEIKEHIEKMKTDSTYRKKFKEELKKSRKEMEKILNKK